MTRSTVTWVTKRVITGPDAYTRRVILPRHTRNLPPDHGHRFRLVSTDGPLPPATTPS